LYKSSLIKVFNYETIEIGSSKDFKPEIIDLLASKNGLVEFDSVKFPSKKFESPND